MTRRTALVVLMAVLALGLSSFGSALATEGSTESGEDSARDRLLAEGRVVYEANCVGCHQPDGAGLSGTFPPLVDNPRVADTAYLRQVVQQGLSGEIEVNGETYDGVMPGFSALSDEQIDSLIAYVQEGLGAPDPVTTTVPAAAPADDPLPFPAIVAYTLAFSLFALAVAAVVGSLIVAKRSRGTFSTGQVWLKALLIFAYFVVATVFIPSMIVESSLLASPPAIYEDLFSGKLWGVIRDLIGTGVWLGALLFGFWALRRAQRRDMI